MPFHAFTPSAPAPSTAFPPPCVAASKAVAGTCCCSPLLLLLHGTIEEVSLFREGTKEEATDAAPVRVPWTRPRVEAM